MLGRGEEDYGLGEEEMGESCEDSVNISRVKPDVPNTASSPIKRKLVGYQPSHLHRSCLRGTDVFPRDILPESSGEGFLLLGGAKP